MCKSKAPKCSVCGSLNHARDRNYSCECDYKAHQDHLGAINIIHATAVAANSISP